MSLLGSSPVGAYNFGGGSGGGGGGITSINIGTTVFVDAINGNNSTALRGRLDLPAADIATAKSLAVSGDTIWVWTDLTNQDTLNQNGKALYYVIWAKSIDFSANITDSLGFNICNIYAPYCFLSTSAGDFYVNGDSTIEANIISVTGDIYFNYQNLSVKANQISASGNIYFNSGGGALNPPNIFDVRYIRGSLEFIDSVSVFVNTIFNGASTSNVILFNSDNANTNIIFDDCNINVDVFNFDNTGLIDVSITFKNCKLNSYNATSEMFNFLEDIGALDCVLRFEGNNILVQAGSATELINFTVSPVTNDLQLQVVGRIDSNKTITLPNTNIDNQYTGWLLSKNTNLS